MQRVLDAVPERLQGHTPSALETYLYLLAVLHEDMHGEALTYMRQTLAYPAPQLESMATAALPAALGRGPCPGDVTIPGGTFFLGATPDQPFVFDNEKWAHAVEVAPFQMARAPVTNAEFAAFVEDGRLPAAGVLECARLALAYQSPGPASLLLATRRTGVVSTAFRGVGAAGPACAGRARDVV